MDLLNEIPGATIGGEVLNRWETFGYRPWWSSGPLSTWWLKRSLHCLPGDIRGAKLVFDQLEHAGLSIDAVVEALPTALFVVLYRRDLLAHFLSMESSIKQGRWKSYSSLGDHEVVTVDAGRFTAFSTDMADRYTSSVRTLRRINAHVQAVSYEEVCADPLLAVDEKVCQPLGLPPPPDSTAVTVMDRIPSKKRIANWDDLCRQVPDRAFEFELG